MNTKNFINQDTFIISDHHFGHNKVGKFEPVRFSIAKKFGHCELDKCAIERHNDTVGDNDNVLFLGDFAFKGIEYFTKTLKGNKIIILGNHDRKAPLYKNYGWKVFEGIHIDLNMDNSFVYNDKDISLLSGLVKDICGKRILFSHYPVFDDNTYDRANKRIRSRTVIFEEIFKKFNCDMNIHGHVHSKRTSFDKCVNVSVEKLDFTPVRISSLL